MPGWFSTDASREKPHSLMDISRSWVELLIVSLYLQIKCGDLFENSVVDEFNECAVSRKKCVPKKSDVGEFPVPNPSALVTKFNMSDFNGKWFISSGLNPTFDAFDCQLHEFHVESDKLVGNLSWRIRTPDTGFFTRSTVQKFVQDPVQPGILYNHDNEYLHYQDDWSPSTAPLIFHLFSAPFQPHLIVSSSLEDLTNPILCVLQVHSLIQDRKQQ